MDTQQDTDKLLFNLLDSRGIASSWAKCASPRTSLTNECNELLSDSEFCNQLSEYLNNNPIILESLETVLAQLAFSAGVNWKNASEILQPLARRGWHLSRWLPTFLLIDGPLGRLLRDHKSPLAKQLKENYFKFPMLANSRDAFNNEIFRKVRNGFAHWSFTWRDRNNSTLIEIINWESGLREIELSLLEAEALHYLSATLMQALDQELLRKVRVESG